MQWCTLAEKSCLQVAFSSCPYQQQLTLPQSSGSPRSTAAAVASKHSCSGSARPASRWVRPAMPAKPNALAVVAACCTWHLHLPSTAGRVLQPRMPDTALERRGRTQSLVQGAGGGAAGHRRHVCWPQCGQRALTAFGCSCATSAPFALFAMHAIYSLCHACVAHLYLVNSCHGAALSERQPLQERCRPSGHTATYRAPVSPSL